MRGPRRCSNKTEGVKSHVYIDFSLVGVCGKKGGRVIWGGGLNCGEWLGVNSCWYASSDTLPYMCGSWPQVSASDSFTKRNKRVPTFRFPKDDRYACGCLPPLLPLLPLALGDAPAELGWIGARVACSGGSSSKECGFGGTLKWR